MKIPAIFARRIIRMMVTVEQLTKELMRLPQDRLEAVWAFLQALKWVKPSTEQKATTRHAVDIRALYGIVSLGGDAVEDAERLYDE
jgi:hypothetical protein